MADKTKIEWTRSADGAPGATWNPVAGCSLVSPGCTHCYAMRVAWRLHHVEKYVGLTELANGRPVWTGTVRLDETALTQPLRWRQPRRIFVNSMSDWAHDGLSFDDMGRIFSAALAAPQHTYLFLTKRASRQREFVDGWCHYRGVERPPDNFWLGVSVEDQARADERIPELLATPAAKRFISAEPLLGAIDLRNLVIPRRYGSGLLDAFTLDFKTHHQEIIAGPPKGHGPLDWVIAGGESGPRARPMYPDWARSLRDQCVAAGVPFFLKQWGEYTPVEAATEGGETRETMIWVGKRAAGRLLDGREWNEVPA